MRKSAVVMLFLVGLLVSAACNLSSLTGGAQPSVPTVVIDAEATQESMIIAAANLTATQLAMEAQLAQIQTQTAQAPVVATATEEPAGGEPTATAEGAATAEATATLEAVTDATATAAPSETPTATVTPSLPTATQTPLVQVATQTPMVSIPPVETAVPCNGAKFVSDVTVPDGTTFPANSTFTKTWRIRNTGTCTWNNQYDLVYDSGTQMGGPSVVDLNTTVSPGGELDISVNLTAPGSSGDYRGNWKLRDDKGVIFGVGGRNAALFVKISVSGSSSGSAAQGDYDFAANYCAASWSSGAGTLGCPGTDGDSKGFVLRFDTPKLETGQIDDEMALLTNPQAIHDGVIRGKYPAVRIEVGQYFRSLIGCAYDVSSCDVRFQLDYQIGDGSVQTLASWNEKSDGKLTSVNVDLSSLAGKDVKFILVVFANGASDRDRAQWLAPRIQK